MKKIIIICGVFVFGLLTVFQTNAQSRKAVGAAEVTGTFREKASGSEFKISALGKGKLKVGFSGVYPYKTANGEDMANMGEAAGEARISGDTATFAPEGFQECRITLKFLTGGRLKVTQNGTDGDCGFGANISASGTYKKISSKKPNSDAN